jgi:hypothetical protein
MRLLLATLHLSWLGGATTYLLTVAPALQRLGHDVTLYSPDAGENADRARARGLRVATRESELPTACDGVLVQDTVMALELAERLRAPQVFVSHGAEADLAAPPQVGEQTAAVVAMNDRVARRANALALDAEVVRLTQPIDTERFWSRGPLRNPPARALLLGNYLAGQRREMITRACEAHGLAWHQLGRETAVAADVTDAIADADIVVGFGRSVLEAMASARAAYVFDYMGGDGWVTPESYAAFERGGFTGGIAETPPTRASLAAGLAAYDPEMGEVNRQLVLAHHSALEHATSLAALFGRVAGRVPAPLPAARELARVVRSQWHADWRAQELWRELERERAALLAAERRAAEAEARAASAQDRMRALARTRRWRAVQRLLAPLDRARGRR